MNIEKINGPKGPQHSDKKDRKSTPDSEEFKDLMRTKKVGETEFEKPKKRRFKQLAEEKEETSIPYESKTSSLKSPYEKKLETKPFKSEEELETKPQTLKEEKNHAKGQVQGKKEEKLQPKSKKPESLTIERKKRELPVSHKEKIQKEKKLETLKKEEKTELTKKEEKEKEKEKKEVIERKEHYESLVLQEFPKAIAAQAQSICETQTPYLHHDISALFEKMVGEIIQIKAQGITTTEVILNSSAFTSSIFFGSHIVLEKYSTAPDAFNITLQGPKQAVDLFNENIDGLYNAFKNSNIKIGRLQAEHERPLFKRKERPDNKGSQA